MGVGRLLFMVVSRSWGGGLGEFFSFSLCRPSRIKELDLIVTPW